MDAFSAWQGALTFVFFFVAWFMPNIKWYWKAIFSLIVLLVSCGLFCLRLYKKILRLKNERDEIGNKHRALAKRFDEKRNEINRYSAAFASIDYLISVAVQTTKQDRVVVLYQRFLDIKARFFDNELNK